MGKMESRFADLVWEKAPISTAELAKVCQTALGWQRTTMYTVLKRFCDERVFENDAGTVRVLIDRDAFYIAQSVKYVNDSFNGSLPAFFSAFSSGAKLTDEEIDELKEMIEGLKNHD